MKSLTFSTRPHATTAALATMPVFTATDILTALAVGITLTVLIAAIGLSLVASIRYLVRRGLA